MTHSQHTNKGNDHQGLHTHGTRIFSGTIHGYIERVDGHGGPVIAYSQNTHFDSERNKPPIIKGKEEKIVSSVPGKHYHE
jgi:hypothetical protein